VRATVVFESMFGHTGHLAQEVGQALAAAGTDVIDVRHATGAELRCDLLVVAAPTHVFSRG